MASVWEARQHDPERRVAIKILAEDISKSPKDIEAFYNEASIASKLDHENIVTVFEVGCQAGKYYYVMELASGYDTAKWLARKGKLKELDVLTVAESVGVALNFAVRSIDMIHCDIKPSNLVVDSDGTLRITDMGIARKVHSNTTSDYITGTPGYMSPEQAVGRSDLDERADIYSLGATLYHLLTGRTLFAEKDDEKILEAQCSEQADDARDFNPEISDPCAVMLAKMLAKNRDNRYKNWDDALFDIRALISYHTTGVVPQRLRSFRSLSTMRLKYTDEMLDSLPSKRPETPPPYFNIYTIIAAAVAFLLMAVLFYYL